MKRTTSNLLWQEAHWTRPYSQDDMLELLLHLDVLSPRKQIVWGGGRPRKSEVFIEMHSCYLRSLKSAFSAHGNITFSDVLYSDRIDVTACKTVKNLSA